MRMNEISQQHPPPPHITHLHSRNRWTKLWKHTKISSPHLSGFYCISRSIIPLIWSPVCLYLMGQYTSVPSWIIKKSNVKLNGSNYFNKIDLKSSYRQVPMEQTDVWKSAFKYLEVLFEWLVIPFRLNNSPTTFMRIMDDIIFPFTNCFVVIYLDEIPIFSRTWAEYF